MLGNKQIRFADQVAQSDSKCTLDESGRPQSFAADALQVQSEQAILVSDNFWGLQIASVELCQRRPCTENVGWPNSPTFVTRIDIRR
jgi:hypothetical protein